MGGEMCPPMLWGYECCDGASLPKIEDIDMSVPDLCGGPGVGRSLAEDIGGRFGRDVYKAGPEACRGEE
jgi:hypothetical protein